VRNHVGLLWLGLLATLVAAGTAAQDPIRIAPNHYHLELENRWVRVLRLKLGPHENVPLHEEPESVVAFLTGAHERLTSPGKPGQEIAISAEGVSHFEASRYVEENLADQPLEAVVIELKPAAPDSHSAPWPPPLDPMKLDPMHHSVLFENSRVRVLRTVLEPHLKGPLHEHPHYVVVYLTVLHTTMTMADGRAIDNPRQPGDVAWRDPLKHVTENIGDQQAVEIQVELK
jgi:quercetin dioxygenase-like cupin family protein